MDIVFSYTLVHLLIISISALVNSKGGSGAFLGLGAGALASGAGGAEVDDMVGGKKGRNTKINGGIDPGNPRP